VPESLRDVPVDEFLDRLPDYDAQMEALLEAARAKNGKLRYVARLTVDGQASVGLDTVDANSAFSHINLTDNVVEFVTDRYSSNPLVVQGPGAGPAVTAGGVFADLLRLAALLGNGLGL
jgi:aspartokinase/homoserine dehydrogenase 1